VTQGPVEQRVQLRRLVASTLVVTLCIAALTAIVAILSGDFDDTDAYVIGTSIGFAVFTATAASGAALRYRQSESLRLLAMTTIALSALTFGLLVLALWTEWYPDDAWQRFGCFAIATLTASHASLVSGARRASDTEAVGVLATLSICLAVFDGAAGILAVSQVVDEVDTEFGQLLAALVVLLFLTSVLQPIVRRLHQGTQAPGTRPQTALTTELLALADRLDALNADPARRSSEIRRECKRLRELARAHDA
jgi:hypothetical protein